ncbi:hypothetical protein [Hyphomicrobium sp.]|uniref:hypothetical protein n=1 Tax=Hyphomicrobium sp. TaxID=82 RepID=UPI0025C67D08|nr:hypothetical protein [Hyphomicrobium sp.]MCC7253844.1 hypothetical protein [Hyphomicrobium sp.]
MNLALGAFLRMVLGWRLDLPEKERKEIAAQAQALLDGGERGEWADVIAATELAREPFDDIEARALKGMSRLASQLPVWAGFGASIRGFGPASLAVIVAEAGDLSNYANPGKLWKRMGLAVMGDVRQGGLAKGASKEAWIEHGYSPQRRSRMWNIGDALIKSNRDGEYRTLYLARKEYELARDPEMKPIKAHRRAQRYMEKRLLKNLWQAWRRAMAPTEPMYGLPAAPPSPQGAPQAKVEVQPNTVVPAATSSADEAERSAETCVPPVGRLPSALSQEAA